MPAAEEDLEGLLEEGLRALLATAQDQGMLHPPNTYTAGDQAQPSALPLSPLDLLDTAASKVSHRRPQSKRSIYCPPIPDDDMDPEIIWRNTGRIPNYPYPPAMV